MYKETVGQFPKCGFILGKLVKIVRIVIYERKVLEKSLCKFVCEKN